MLANENYLDELQVTKIKKSANLLKELEEFKEDTKKQLSGIKDKELKENERLRDVQEDTSTRLTELTKTTQDLRKNQIKRQKH